MSEIISRSSLREYVNELTKIIGENPDESNRLAKYVENLSHKIHLGGFIDDELTGKKYFVSFGQLQTSFINRVGSNTNTLYRIWI